MNNLKRIFPFMRPYRWVLFLTLLTTFLPAAMELIVPRVLRTIIDQGIIASDMNVIWRGSGPCC